MFDIFNPFPTGARVSFGHPDDWRIVFDFTGTVVAGSRSVVIADLEPEELGVWLRKLAPGTLAVIVGLEVLPSSAEGAARLVARACRRARSIELYCDCAAAPSRWRRRFTGNLVRFGCIEPGEAISDLSLPHAGAP